MSTPYEDIARRLELVRAALEGLSTQERLAVLGTAFETLVRNLPEPLRAKTVGMVCDLLHDTGGPKAEGLDKDEAADVIVDAIRELDPIEACGLLAGALTVKLKEMSQNARGEVLMMMMMGFARDVPGVKLKGDDTGETLQ